MLIGFNIMLVWTQENVWNLVLLETHFKCGQSFSVLNIDNHIVLMSKRWLQVSLKTAELISMKLSSYCSCTIRKALVCKQFGGKQIFFQVAGGDL